MPLASTDDHNHHPGVFWIATKPHETSDGVLRIRPETSPELVINAAFYPSVELITEQLPGGVTKTSHRQAEDPGPQTLHGLLSSATGEATPVSMFQAHSTNWNGASQTFQPIWSVIGGHVEPTQTYERLRLRIHRYAPAAAHLVELRNGGIMAVDAAEGWIELTDLPARGYRELERSVVVPICTLLTLATGKRIRPSHIQLGPRPGTWWSVHAASHVSANPASPHALIRPSDISLRTLATWLDRADVLGSLPAGVASAWQDGLPIDTQILILTTAAEGLHRALHPYETRFPEDEGAIVRQVATEAVRAIRPAAADAVSGFLTHVHEVSYATRLRQLAARAEELVPGITGNTTRWKNLVYAIRNEYAHKPSTEWVSEAEIDRLLTASESLRWILRLLFLDQAGLDPELIAARFRLSQRYNYFVRDATEWQPQVYPEKPMEG